MRHNLTENQIELLRVLWRRGEASVQEVHAALTQTRDVAPATVATMLNRLCKDGVMERIRNGRQFRYRAVVSEDELRGSMLNRVMERLFAGDGSALLSHLVRNQRISAEDLDEARALLRQTDENSPPRPRTTDTSTKQHRPPRRRRSRS
ncbi:MAG: BlaI/MecI/CopY family transcriptional regulator [Nannocystaceae bacterium]